MTETLTRDTLRGFDLTLATQPGVFAAHGIDHGTRLLIEAMHVSPTARVLDLGCGCGVIGIVAARLAERGSVTLVDTDIRAARLTQRNLELNNITNAEVILGDSVHDLPPKARFDVVASNPPTHSGREVLDEFVHGAYKFLRPRGNLYLVINRLLSLKREVETVFGHADVVARDKGFVVIRATKEPHTRDNDDIDAAVLATVDTDARPVPRVSTRGTKPPSTPLRTPRPLGGRGAGVRAASGPPLRGRRGGRGRGS